MYSELYVLFFTYNRSLQIQVPYIYIYEDEVLLMQTMLLGQIIMTVYTFQNLKRQDAGGLVITKPDADQPTELGAWSSGQVPFSSQITLTKAAYDSQVCYVICMLLLMCGV